MWMSVHHLEKIYHALLVYFKKSNTKIPADWTAVAAQLTIWARLGFAQKTRRAVGLANFMSLPQR